MRAEVHIAVQIKFPVLYMMLSELGHMYQSIGVAHSLPVQGTHEEPVYASKCSEVGGFAKEKCKYL
jgi:hypothetical protein